MDIQPEKQNLDQAFSNIVYFIDFYQRDYKWTDEPVKRLLDDVFYQFDETYSYKDNSKLDASLENVNARYPWYYLNTYVTNIVGGKVYVVDGQQRLTTLTLILIKLFNMSKELESETDKWIESKIAGYSGKKRQFWMNHVRHINILEELMQGTDLDSIKAGEGITPTNMIENYRKISEILDRKLNNDTHKFETFVYFFLYRLVLINLSVETDHVPMVFEVINDRGVRLQPYEILKGKLLGQIDKVELDSGGFNELWDSQVLKVNQFKEDEIDTFMRHWLKAKFAGNKKEGQRFDGDYHREIFKEEMEKALRLDHNPAEVKKFLRGDFKYYSDLYARLLTAAKQENDDYPAVFFNNLNELDTQHMLIISACSVNDAEEKIKIRAVSEGLDRVFTLLQLQGAYDSGQFNERLFEISQEIRTARAQDIAGIFESHLVAELSERKLTEVNQSFSYGQFKSMSIDRIPKRFTRYFFARIEKFLSEGHKLDMKHPLYDLVAQRGSFHVEHILAHNDENLSLFGNDNEVFEQERGRLGGALLLKGKDNQSSNNETYTEKLKSYANTLYWNETLREDTYQSKLDFRDFQKRTGLKFRAMNKFGPEELEERQKLLFDIVTVIWGKSLSSQNRVAA